MQQLLTKLHDIQPTRVVLTLPFTPPLDWETLLAYFRAHQIPGLESVTAKQYERVFYLDDRAGFLRVSRGRAKAALRLEIFNSPKHSLPWIQNRIRHMFDLDAEPEKICKVMAGLPHLGKLWKKYPGLRIARSWNRFETLINTVLGQLVSVSFGRSLTRELMDTYGERMNHPVTGNAISLFPHPRSLRSADLAGIRTSELRRKAIREIAALVENNTLSLTDDVDPKELRRLLLSTTGIGAWSAEYIAMRGFGDDDAFPATDYALKQEIRRYPEMNLSMARPYRAYAAVALWKNFAESKRQV